MKTFNFAEMKRGWFVGDFEPTALRTQDVEVAVKRYSAGDKEETHYHKKATELTLILAGEVIMNGIAYAAGDIVVLDPGQCTDFEAVQDTLTVVVKHPGATNDKYLAASQGR